MTEGEREGESRVVSQATGRNTCRRGNVLQVVQLAARGLGVGLQILLELLHIRLLH